MPFVNWSSNKEVLPDRLGEPLKANTFFISFYKRSVFQIVADKGNFFMIEMKDSDPRKIP